MDDNNDVLKSTKKIIPNDSVDNMESSFKDLNPPEKIPDMIKTPTHATPINESPTDSKRQILEPQQILAVEQKDTLMTLQSNKDVTPTAKNRIANYLSGEVIYFINWGLFLCSIQMLFGLFVWLGGGIGLILCMACGLAVKILLHKVEKLNSHEALKKIRIPLIVLIIIILAWNAVLICYLIALMATQSKPDENHLFNVLNSDKVKRYEVITSCFSQLIILAPTVITYIISLKNYRVVLSECY